MPDERKWQPQTVLRYVRTVRSSSRTAFVQTDAGGAYLKAVNNPEGPHVLACDWFGTHLARRFGLPTFDVAVVPLDEMDEIQLEANLWAGTGAAFVAREEQGNTMGGAKMLNRVANLDVLPRLIVFDTWVRNCDRYAPGYGRDGQPRINYDNLFLSTEDAPSGKFTLKAIDQGHIFTCGRRLTPRLADIENTHDERLYGFFPFFQSHVTREQIIQVGAELRDVTPRLWEDLLTALPEDWEVTLETKQAITRFLQTRARFLAVRLPEMVRAVGPQRELDFTAGENHE